MEGWTEDEDALERERERYCLLGGKEWKKEMGKMESN